MPTHPPQMLIAGTIGRRWAEGGGWDESADVHVLAPGGMGDFHWLWTKLAGWALGRRVKFWLAAGDGRGVRRAAAFARLCGVEAEDDPLLRSTDVWSMPGAPALRERGVLVVHANRHLEAGLALESWYPELPPVRDYPLHIPEAADARAAALLAALPPGGIVGVFTGGARYMGGQHPPEEWARRLRGVLATWPEAGLALLGAGEDVPHLAEIAALLPGGRAAAVFNQPVPVLLAVLRRCRAFVGAAGGPGIVGMRLGVPAALFYPAHLARLPGAWEPPSLLAAGDCPWGLLRELPTCFDLVYPLLQRALRGAPSPGGREAARCVGRGGRSGAAPTG
jgi:hypothetical protein